DLDHRSDRLAPARLSDELDANPAVSERLVVAEEERPSPHLGDQEIEVSDGVDVRVRRATPHHRTRAIARALLGGRDERRVMLGPGVPEDLRRLLVALARLDLVDLLLEVAVGLEEIGPTVEVDIEEEEAKGQHLPARGTDAFGSRLIEEAEVGSVSDVERAHLRREVSDPDADDRVVSVMADVDPHGTGRSARLIEGDARLVRDLTEGPVAQVAEEEIRDGVV